MITYCFLCQMAYQVTGESREVEMLLDAPEWEESFPCATPRCHGRTARVSMEWLGVNTARVKKIEAISLHTYYRAINGFGRPDINLANLPAVKSELVTKKISIVDGYSTGNPPHTILKKLVMEDGTMLHFAASAHGACIYAIDQPGPTCVEVLDDQLEADDHYGTSESTDRQAPEGGSCTDRVDEGSGEGGEEGGRSVEDTESLGAAGSTSVAGTHRSSVPSLSERSSLHPGSGSRG